MNKNNINVTLPARMYSADYKTVINWTERHDGKFLIDPSKANGFKLFIAWCAFKVAKACGAISPSTALVPNVVLRVELDNGTFLDKVSNSLHRWLLNGYMPDELFILVGQDLLPELRAGLGSPHLFTAPFDWNVTDPDRGVIATYKGVDVMIMPHTGGYAIIPRKQFEMMLTRRGVEKGSRKLERY